VEEKANISERIEIITGTTNSKRGAEKMNQLLQTTKDRIGKMTGRGDVKRGGGRNDGRQVQYEEFTRGRGLYPRRGANVKNSGWGKREPVTKQEVKTGELLRSRPNCNEEMSRGVGESSKD